MLIINFDDVVLVERRESAISAILLLKVKLVAGKMESNSNSSSKNTIRSTFRTMEQTY